MFRTKKKPAASSTTSVAGSDSGHIILDDHRIENNNNINNNNNNNNNKDDDEDHENCYVDCKDGVIGAGGGGDEIDSDERGGRSKEFSTPSKRGVRSLVSVTLDAAGASKSKPSGGMWVKMAAAAAAATTTTAAADAKESAHRRHNRLHPDSIFEQRRCSLSNCVEDCAAAAANSHRAREQSQQQQQQQRRASYDRHQLAADGPESAPKERRASYDVSFLKRAAPPPSPTSPHTRQDPKSSRRDSLVRRWLDRLSNAADAHKSKDSKHKPDRSSDVSGVSGHDLESGGENASESSTKTKDDDGCNSNESSSTRVNARHSDESSPATGESAAKKSSGGGSDGASPSLRKKQILSAEPPRLTTEVPLIEPSQVLISQRSVLTAEPVLTPLERLRRKDDVIKEALLEKQKLVADILHVPKGEFDSTDDFVAESIYDKEASELVLAAVNRVDHLTSILNECLRVTEEDVIAASCEVNATNKSSSLASGNGGSNSGSSVRIIPAVPVPRLQTITHSLSAHLIQLLTLVTERDEEREKLRQELQRSREKLHAVYEMQQLAQCLDDQSTAPTQPPAPAPSPNQVIENLTSNNQSDENKNVETSTTLETADNSS